MEIGTYKSKEISQNLKYMRRCVKTFANIMEHTLQIILLSHYGCPGFLVSRASTDGVPIRSIYCSQLSKRNIVPKASSRFVCFIPPWLGI